MARSHLAELVFTPDTVARFASIIGDLNPFHTDAVLAARSPLGRPNVGGSLLAGTLLQQAAASDLAYSRCTFRFRSWLYVGDVARVFADGPIWTVEDAGGRTLVKARFHEV